MGRRAAIVPTQALCLKLPQDIYAKLTLYLYNETEQRVTRGSYQKFFIDLLNDFFANEELNDDT